VAVAHAWEVSELASLSVLAALAGSVAIAMVFVGLISPECPLPGTQQGLPWHHACRHFADKLFSTPQHRTAPPDTKRPLTPNTKTLFPI